MARHVTKETAARYHVDDVARFVELLGAGELSEHSYAVLLGLSDDAAALHSAVATGLPYSAWERFLDNSGIGRDSLRGIVHIPARTLSRRKKDGRFSPTESDRLARTARVFGHALSLFEGDPDAARAWLTTAQPGLGGATPLAYASTDLGAREVERLAGRLEHGIPS